MKGMFEKSKNITWTENNVKVMSAVKEENVKEIEHWPKNSANKKLRREERIWENAPLDFAKGKDSGVFRSPLLERRFCGVPEGAGSPCGGSKKAGG